MKKRKLTAKTERAGVHKTAWYINELNHVWRETSNDDVGLDGTIEVVLEENATGRFFGVQVKSGESYIRSETTDEFTFYADPEDISYWRSVVIPVVLVVYDPRNQICYWKSISEHIEKRSNIDQPETTLRFQKRQQIDASFSDWLLSQCDLRVIPASELAEIETELNRIQYGDAQHLGVTPITGTDLFVFGLWGLCTKLQFHLSILTDLIRQRAVKSGNSLTTSYGLSFEALNNFFLEYLRILTKYNIAALDTNDIANSIYVKREWPTFISNLTFSGRQLVSHLRNSIGETVRDNQFYFSYQIPHMQIEFYEKFDEKATPFLIDCRMLVCISFNRYLDFYDVKTYQAGELGKPWTLTNSQRMYYFELLNYLNHLMDSVDPNTIMLRNVDDYISPLALWLDHRINVISPFDASNLELPTLSHQIGLTEELMSIMSPSSAGFTVHDNVLIERKFPQQPYNGQTIIFP